jgi:hypothetical protein
MKLVCPNLARGRKNVRVPIGPRTGRPRRDSAPEAELRPEELAYPLRSPELEQDQRPVMVIAPGAWTAFIDRRHRL